MPVEDNTPKETNSRRSFWIVLGLVVILLFSGFGYARYRIAKTSRRLDRITDQFIYDVDPERGVKILVPRHEDWKRIEKINAEYEQ